jgi:hypothetical protein
MAFISFGNHHHHFKVAFCCGFEILVTVGYRDLVRICNAMLVNGVVRRRLDTFNISANAASSVRCRQTLSQQPFPSHATMN